MCKKTKYGTKSCGKTGNAWGNYVYQNDDVRYAKTANRALSGNSISCKGSTKFYYPSSSGIRACEDICNQCGNCKGFVDNREASPPYCAFKKTTNIYVRDSKDWYAKPVFP